MFLGGCAIGGCNDDSSGVVGFIILGIVLLVAVSCLIIYFIKKKTKH